MRLRQPPERQRADLRAAGSEAAAGLRDGRRGLGGYLNLQLSIGMAANPPTWPVFDGPVEPDGTDLRASAGHPSELLWRQRKLGAFQLSGQSMASLVRCRGQ